MTPRATPREQRNREMVFELIGPHVKRLDHYVRHLIRYREAAGDLRPGELTPEEVVDAVVLRAYGQFVKQPPMRTLKRWLVGLAREQVASEVRALRSWREHTPVHTEDDVPEIPPEESVSRLGEETLEFHEPDEDLKVEDVIPDLGLATPEQEAESDELRWSMDAALGGLPADWRQIVLLHYVEGLAGSELARVAGQSAAEVEQVLDLSRQYLRQRLVEAGWALRRATPR